MRTAILLSLVLSGCALTTLMTQGRSLPQLAGEAEAEGLAGEVVVHRDERGVPHIRAASEADAAFALGYAHAQDRLFQLDATRRLAYGELSAYIGPKTADLDTFMAGLGLRAQAEASLKALEPETRFVIAAYTAGVNAGADSLKGLSIEHRLLKQDRWTEWTPLDTMASIYLFSLTLSTNAPQELVAYQLRDRLDRADVDALFGPHPQATPVEADWGRLRTTQAGELTGPAKAFFETLTIYHSPQASNAWVVGPERSADGKPILANDVHLHLLVPSPWYVADVSGGGVHAAGFTVPGLPGVVAGHNDSLAWGVTNVGADYMDLAVVERVGEQGYRLNGVDETLEARSVTVEVKDEGSRTETVNWTKLGPVLTELDGKHLLVLRWHAMETVDRSADVLRALARAGSVEEALPLSDTSMIVSLNLLLADTTGDFGWTITGQHPVREGHTGRVPYIASDARPAPVPEEEPKGSKKKKPAAEEPPPPPPVELVAPGWTGFAAERVRIQAPEAGFIASANSLPVIDGAPSPLGAVMAAQYELPWRQHRIEALLSETPTHTVDTIAEIQLDRHDPQAKANLARLINVSDPNSVGAKWVRDTLADWDYQTDAESIAPLIWGEFQEQLIRQLLTDELGEDGVEMYLAVAPAGQTVLDVDGGLERFTEDPDMAIRKALLNTWDSLVATYGEDTSLWEWGDVHAVAFDHPFAAEVSQLSMLNAGTVAGAGSDNTVAVGGSSWVEGWQTDHISSFRLIMPLSDLSASTYVLPPGNSGQPASRHYQDQLRTWARGDRNDLYYTNEQVERFARSALVLTPPKP
ncbi:MAG: penicillin acylase family protein [Alphaproteobacteria bacterium]|nr:penicillin acylase family protein [Alphaproteobacteria bacterium]